MLRTHTPCFFSLDGELQKWSKDVKVFFQPKGVIDGPLMKDIYEYWGRAFSPDMWGTVPRPTGLRKPRRGDRRMSSLAELKRA